MIPRRPLAAVLALSASIGAGAVSLESTQSATVPAPARVATGSLPPPRFTDPDRARRLAAAYPAIERILRDWTRRAHVPGAVLGVIVDGRLAWVTSTGVRDTGSNGPVDVDTIFRIASMTKSFTAMAILSLRDAGRLSLEDPVAKYVPEMTGFPYPTADSPVLTIRHLLTHSEGLPEDNPWGDRQLAQPDAVMSDWLRAGLPFSNAPGLAYEYSNFGFALLGRIVQQVSGRPYEDYVRSTILEPLGMTSTTFHADRVPAARKALGYRWEDERWKEEPALAHGSFGAMGGLWTSANDLAKYVGFLMSAFPPRDDAETGPIGRASAREMQQASRAIPATALRPDVGGPLALSAGGYAFGLRVTQDCLFDYGVGHGGGLPGYGSLERWLPDYGVGLVGMANVTYAGFGQVFTDALAALHETGGLERRAVQPAPALLEAQRNVSSLVVRWDDALASRTAADNLFLDRTAERRKSDLEQLRARHGACRAGEPIVPENALRGTWKMPCERGWLKVSITLAPTEPPRVQYLNVRSVMPPDARMQERIGALVDLATAWNESRARATVAPDADLARIQAQLAAVRTQWGHCGTGESIGGSGSTDAEVVLKCDKGELVARLALDGASGRLTRVDIVPRAGQACVP